MNRPGPFSLMADSLKSLVSGIGTSRDKMTSLQYQLPSVNRQQLEYAYRGDWIARKIVDIPAQDATREWRTWNGEEDQVRQIRATEYRLGLQSKTKRALIKARLFGGGALIIGTGDADPTQPLRPETVGRDGLLYVHSVSKNDLAAEQIVQDVASNYYGQPEFYQVTSRTAGATRIHASRIVRLIGAEYPDTFSASHDGWGDSILTPLDDALKQAGLSLAGVASMLNEAKTDVLKIPGLMGNLTTQEYTDRLQTRLMASDQMKSLLRTVVTDAEEEWERVQINFSGLPEIVRVYLMVASAAADIPATRMLGQSPDGMNATGDSDTRNYYDRVSSEQETVISPALELLDECLIRSALGNRPPEIDYEWASLWQMDDAQKADVAQKKSQALSVYIQSGLLPDEAMAEGLANMIEADGLMPGFSAAMDNAGDLDEDDPEVKAEFDTGPSDDVQKQALNGAQIKAVQEIVLAVALGQMPAETAIQLIMIGFPFITEADARALVAPMDGFEASTGVTADAKPRTLYVRRDVLNASEIIAWAKSQGFDTTLPADDMHVTIAFSRTPVDWIDVGESWAGSERDGTLTITPGGPRMIEKFDGGATVLLFGSSELGWRHHAIREKGASWDWPEYQPHVTLSYDFDGDISEVEPYQGAIKLGPEIFEEIDENWRSGISET